MKSIVLQQNYETQIPKKRQHGAWISQSRPLSRLMSLIKHSLAEGERTAAPAGMLPKMEATRDLMSNRPPSNVDPAVAAGFGHEWSTFRQSDDALSVEDRAAIFESYFHIFPWDRLRADCTGMDVGCGSGRWSVMVAPRVGHLHLLDVSADARDVARENLSAAKNVTFHLASVGEVPLPDASLDFAFSLGVLHHVPEARRRHQAPIVTIAS